MPELFDTQVQNPESEGNGSNEAADKLLAQSMALQQTRRFVNNDEGTVVTDFLQSAAYSGLQSPASGLTQLVDEITGSKLQEKVQEYWMPPHLVRLTYKEVMPQSF